MCEHDPSQVVSACLEERCGACYGEELVTEEFRPAARLPEVPLFVDARGTIHLVKDQFNTPIGESA